MSVFSIPGALAPYPVLQFFDNGGLPLQGGKLYTYLAGTSTPSPVYTSHLLNVPHANPIILDSSGRAVIYLGARAYKWALFDSEDTLIWTQDQIQDIGQVFIAQLGVIFATGSRDVLSGYEVLSTDVIVTVNSTGGASPAIVNLMDVATRFFLLEIKNKGTEPVDITPFLGQTIEGISAPFTLPAAESPIFPTVLLAPDSPSNWDIVSSHGLHL